MKKFKNHFVFSCFFFNFSSEARDVLNLFLIFWEIEPQRSYKVRSYKKRVYAITVKATEKGEDNYFS